jgi:hydroxymethylpyrimidine/phosphomethylpyrimidine kinase
MSSLLRYSDTKFFPLPIAGANRWYILPFPIASMIASPPPVLCLSGHDPTGAAGIQADIETLARLGCHACSVITSLTMQDTHDVQGILPQERGAFLRQARLLVADIPPVAVKIGLLGSPELAWAVAELLEDLPGIPVVLDPILAAGGGRNLAGGDSITEINRRLLPKVAVVTPNIPEAYRLTGASSPDVAAHALLALGCPNVLLTGAHADEDGAEVVNRWYRGETMDSYHWPRLEGNYHGSGCTLAAAVAGYLALGLGMADAVTRAQYFAWESLRLGYRLGRGQWLPNRRAVPRA